LTRVEKKAYITGWTLATDNNYTLNFTQPARFADDNRISDYAKASVYFMATKGIINGTGNNNFSPTVTATRQEALIIAARMVDNLKGKTLDYSQSSTTQPTQPQSGGIVGVWVMGDPFLTLNEAIQWIEFKADGTFTSYWDYNPNVFNPFSGNTDTLIYASGMMYDRINTPGVFTYKGRYSFTGNKITLTNVTNSFKVGDTSITVSPVGDYSNQPMADISMSYELRAGGEKHGVDSYTEYDSLRLPEWSTSQRLLYRQRTANGIELWPNTLPSSLRPTGFNGVAKAGIEESKLQDMYDIAEAFGNKEYSWIKFIVNVHNATTLSQLQSYRNNLISIGLSNTRNNDEVWQFEGELLVNGITYDLDISITAYYSEVKITYNFYNY